MSKALTLLPKFWNVHPAALAHIVRKEVIWIVTSWNRNVIQNLRNSQLKLNPSMSGVKLDLLSALWKSRWAFPNRQQSNTPHPSETILRFLRHSRLAARYCQRQDPSRNLWKKILKAKERFTAVAQPDYGLFLAYNSFRMLSPNFAVEPPALHPPIARSEDWSLA